MESAATIRELALELGFDLVGFAPLRPPLDAERFERWLAAGRHAGMEWFERTRDRILDPRKIDSSARSMLVIGMGHGRGPVELEGGGRIARYAAGVDYHNLLTRRLRKLDRKLQRLGLTQRSRAIVDAGPLLERSHAREAGLGFASKAANLLNPDFGPWFFLGELLLELEPPAAPPSPPLGSCGTCTACIDACPTAALVAPGELDANLCLSYQTIENRGSIPHELRVGLGDWVFGCDICSEVCPWGTEAPDASQVFGTHPVVEGGHLTDWLTWGKEEHAERMVGSPLRRPKREGLARNAALVLGNRPSDEGREALEQALEKHDVPIVRAGAYWALATGHLGERGVQAALERAWKRESEAQARDDMARTRELHH